MLKKQLSLEKIGYFESLGAEEISYLDFLAQRTPKNELMEQVYKPSLQFQFQFALSQFNLLTQEERIELDQLELRRNSAVTNSFTVFGVATSLVFCFGLSISGPTKKVSRFGLLGLGVGTITGFGYHAYQISSLRDSMDRLYYLIHLRINRKTRKELN